MSTSSLHSAAAASKEVQRVPRLPRLPIPPLKDTLKRYLESLEPFLKEDAASGGQPFEEAMRQRVAWATEFEEGLGPVLQQRLIGVCANVLSYAALVPRTYALILDLDRASPNNWLDDNFWLKKAYLEWRAPLIINSNWWLAFENDPGVPLDVLNGGGETRKIAGLGMWQIRRAAWLLHRFLDFRQRICS
jgi:carnitine O-acetyltransferase